MNNLLRTVYLPLVVLLSITSSGKVKAQSWQPTNGPLGGLARSIDINSTGELFVGSPEGVFSSTTNGDDWSRTAGSFNSSFLTRIFVVPGTGNLLAGTTNVGLYKSTDDGAIWERQNAVLAASNIQSISSGVNDELIIGSDRGGVFRSSDNGESWTEFNKGLADMRVFAAAQSNNGDFYAGTILTGIYRYGTADTAWTALSSGLSSQRCNWLLAMGSDEMLAATGSGVYKIASGDTIWTELGTTGSSPGFANSLFLDTTGQLFATTLAGVSLYDANNDTWNRMNNGVTNLRTWGLVANQSGHLFLASDAGIFRSQDNAASWTYQVDGFKTSRVETLLELPGGTILAGTESNGIFRTTDDGGSWTASNTGLTAFGIRAMAIDSNGVLYTGISGVTGVARSTDQGNSWEVVNNGMSGSNIMSLTAAANLIYAAPSNTGVFSSADSGASWQAITTDGLTNTSVRALVVDSQGVLFAGTSNGGVFRIAENDAAWTEVNNGLTRLLINTLTLDDSGNLFAGTTGGGVFRTADNGDNWVDVSEGLPSTVTNVLRFSPSGALFAGTTSGVAYSVGSGDSWVTVADGLLDPAINALLIRGNNEVFAGSDGDGVYRNVIVITSIHDPAGNIPAEFSLNQNYPNPFNPTTTITFSVARRSDIKLTIYDLLGNEVRTLLNESTPQGLHSVEWDGRDVLGRNVASGQYFSGWNRKSLTTQESCCC